MVKDAQEPQLGGKCTSGPLDEALSDTGRWLWMRKWKDIGPITHRRQDGLSGLSCQFSVAIALLTECFTSLKITFFI